MIVQQSMFEKQAQAAREAFLVNPRGPFCYFCNKQDCYDVITTENFVVRQTYFHNEHPICKECNQWMINMGAWFTRIIEFTLCVKYWRVRRDRRQVNEAPG